MPLEWPGQKMVPKLMSPVLGPIPQGFWSGILELDWKTYKDLYPKFLCYQSEWVVSTCFMSPLFLSVCPKPLLQRCLLCSPEQGLALNLMPINVWSKNLDIGCFCPALYSRTLVGNYYIRSYQIAYKSNLWDFWASIPWLWLILILILSSKSAHVINMCHHKLQMCSSPIQQFVKHKKVGWVSIKPFFIKYLKG